MLHIQPALETPDPQTRVSEINFIAAQVALLYREPVLTRKGNSSTPILTTEAECHPLQFTRQGCQLRSLRSGWPRQSVFNLCESSIFFRPPHHNMPEIFDREQAPISAVCDRPSMKGPDLIVRRQPLYNFPERGYKGPPSL